MPSQSFKTVYFSDHPSADARRRNLKLAFGEQDATVFDAVAPFSSCELRAILGVQSLRELRETARSEGLPVNTYCLQTLRQWKRVAESETNQLSLPTLGDLGLHSTFRAGRDAALQRWYPWLEAYSPDFVRHVLEKFAPEASRVLDPFGGCGTTPIAAAILGKAAFYSELNPLLQLLIDTKARALLLSSRGRRRVASLLARLADDFEIQLALEEPDRRLAEAYSACFGESQFFGEHVYEQVLRIRALLDRVACSEPLLAQFATVAVAASLIPSSNLKRAGDLRFRRGTELAQIEPLIPLVCRNIRVIASDIGEATTVPIAPVLVSGDARRLSLLPSLSCDAIITSPPYLNGTNYFRNTKVELWFLRSLRAPDDLAGFRLAAVTAGINDVTRKKPSSSRRAVLDVVRALEQCAYDLRIPQMASSYFYDMEEILRAASQHVRPGAIMAMDIGDSIYAGQRVATDTLLTEIAESVGFSLQQSVLLRNRVSRDTSPLRQVLLVFEYRGLSTRPARTRTAKSSWLRSWAGFKKELPHQKEPYSKRNWGHPLHSLCSYQGKMKPALAHFLVRTFVPDGGRMLDPFAGVGTLPFEAALLGRQTYAFEISPAALQIAGAKLGSPNRQVVHECINSLSDYIERNEPTGDEVQRASEVRFNSPVENYFHPRTYREVLLARRYFRLHVPRSQSENLVFACLLHILHGNRPYALSRRSHPITPFAPTGTPEYRPLVPRLEKKVKRSLDTVLPEGFVEGHVFDCDATSWWPQEVKNLDAIVTSPPFFDSTRFYLANWLRLWFTGWERPDFDTRPQMFVDERQKQSFRVYEPIFRQARERLRTGGVFVLHLGRSSKCDMSARISEVAAPWFKVADQFSESVEHCESHGIRDKGTVTAHQFLILS